MLQSISAKYPTARLLSRPGAFGVLLDGDRSLLITINGGWTNEDLRDLLVLFATWLVAEPGYLRGTSHAADGSSFAVIAR